MMLLLLLIAALFTNSSQKGIPKSTCDQKDCLRCELETGQCMKCKDVMLETTRQCQKVCPAGYETTWSLVPSIHGKVCAGRSVLSLVSHKEVTVIAMASVGGAVCIGILLGVLLMKKRSAKSFPDSPVIRALPKMPHDRRPKAEETSVKGKERGEFLAKLRPLRSEAPYILRMMAETRNKFRSFTGPDAPSDTKAKACRAVVRDLSRVLSLVSQKEENLRSAPKDWRRLLTWTERLLVRYKRQQKLKGEHANDDRTTLFMSRQQAKHSKKKRSKNYYFGQISTLPEPHQQEVSETKDQLDFMSVLYMSDAEDNKSLVDSKLESFQEDERKKKEILKLNLNLWNKLLSPKAVPEQQNLELSDVDQKSDFIQSQTFFDHIEAFAFDIPDEITVDNETAKTKCKLNRNDSNNNEKTNSTVKELNKKNLLKNLHYTDQQGNRNVAKARTKIKRISSSLLMKGKWENGKKDTVKRIKRRRPLKRQRQVEKNQKEFIQEKYQCSNRNCADSNEVEEPHNRTHTAVRIQHCAVQSNISSPNIKQMESIALNNHINGGDLYLGVVKKSVCQPMSTYDKDRLHLEVLTKV